MLRRLVPLLFPIAVLIAIPAGVIYAPHLLVDGLEQPWFRTAPYAVLLTAAFLGWRFNECRITLISVLLGGLFFLLMTGQTESSYSFTDVRLLTICLLPLNLLLFFILRDKSLLTLSGLARILLVAGQVAGVWYIATRGVAFWTRVASHTLMLPVSARHLTLPIAGILSAVTTIAGLLWFRRKTEPLLGPLLASAMCACLITLALSVPEAAAWQQAGWDGAELRRGIQALLQAGFTATGLLLVYTSLEQMYGSAFIDPLTRLRSRRALEHRLASLGSRYSIAMVDIDHFKNVNDKFGHDTGDQVLRFIATCLRRALPGRVYRYGGEEFTLIFNRRDKARVKPELEQLRADIEAAEFHLRASSRPRKKPKGKGKSTGRGKSSGAKRIPVTVSIGVATSGSDGKTPAEVIVAADKALYRAKKKGRNRVETAR